MSLQTKHPSYDEFTEDWTLCDDTYRGERAIKRKGVTYLPATSGMMADGMMSWSAPGSVAYNAYRTRAVFHNFMNDAVEMLLGMMWNKPPQIELPEKLKPLLTNATTTGEGLNALLRRINHQQLLRGRLGLLVDMAEKPDSVNPLPYIALYEARRIINWDTGHQEDGRDILNLVVLDETESERQADFSWKDQEKYRMLLMGDPATLQPSEGMQQYFAGQFRGVDYVPENMRQPSLRGKTLEKIPFTFVNTKDLLAEPDDPPLLGLARLCITIYRGEADYRQALFMQGQDTLVVIGGDPKKSYRIGAGASIVLPEKADAKFIGVDAKGLSEMQAALNNDKTLAQQYAGNLVDTRSKQKESGEAMRTRIGAQTASLTQIAQTGAYALEQSLKQIAEWYGADVEEVRVVPNTDFETIPMTGKDLSDLMASKNLGAPLSIISVHRLMKQRGMTTMEYQEELDAIDEEEPLIEPVMGDGTDLKDGTEPNDPNPENPNKRGKDPANPTKKPGPALSRPDPKK